MINFAEIFTGNGFIKNKPANLKEILKIESTFNITLPADYRAFLLWSDGLEGSLGQNEPMCLRLWSIEEILDDNFSYGIVRTLGSGFVGIGTDGGDFCFALDFNRGTRFVSVELGVLDHKYVNYLANSFSEALIKIRDGYIHDDNINESLI